MSELVSEIESGILMWNDVHHLCRTTSSTCLKIDGRQLTELWITYAFEHRVALCSRGSFPRLIPEQDNRVVSAIFISISFCHGFRLVLHTARNRSHPLEEQIRSHTVVVIAAQRCSDRRCRKRSFLSSRRDHFEIERPKATSNSIEKIFSNVN